GLTPVWVLRRQTPEGVPDARQDGPAPATEGHPLPVAAGSPSAPHLAPRASRLVPEGSPATEDRAARVGTMDWTLLKEAGRGVTACPLHATRRQTVFGVGDEKADWLFVGEGPGAEEDARGEPFVGQAGRLLDNMLASIGLKRGQDVYVANILKCRPPGNRVP